MPRQRGPHRGSDRRPPSPRSLPPRSTPPGSGPTQGHPPEAPSRPPPGRGGEPELFVDLRRMLLEPHPLSLLGLGSTMLAAAAPDDPDRPSPTPGGARAHELVRSFLAVDRVETTALLTVLGELVTDELLAKRIERELRRRTHDLPTWLVRLQPLRVDGTQTLSHVLGDGENVFVGVRTGSGHELSIVAYVDHNLGTVVKDAFVIDEPLDVVVTRYEELADDDPDIALVSLRPADARARVESALRRLDGSASVLETDTWPACRPLVQWIVRGLPAGGTGYERPAWDDAARRALAADFLASPHGRNHDDEIARDLLDAVLWCACHQGKGDPLRWSPTSVEILLLDALPRDVVAEADFVAPAPSLLRDFVAFAHDRAGIGPAPTREALAAIDRYDAEFQRTIRRDRQPGTDESSGAAALLDAIGLWDDRLTDVDLEQVLLSGLSEDVQAWEMQNRRRLLDRLAETVGGADMLATLDARPLPDEPFDWPVVPDDVRPRVAEVLGLLDGCCDEMLDDEHRTACRRLLAAVARGDADVFRRRGRAETAAAALAWSIAKANGTLRPYDGWLTVKELLGWFGVAGSVTRRADTLLRAAGIPDARPDGDAVVLRSPRYLTGEQRQSILRARDGRRGLDAGPR